MPIRRRFYRRRPRKYARRTYRKKPISKAVKRYVKREIHRNVENKLVTTGGTFGIVCAKELAYYCAGQAIIPPVSNGSGGNARVGNQVKCVKGTLRAVFSLAPYNVVTNSLPDPVIVKVWLIRTLATSYQGTTLSNNFLDNFFRNTTGSVGFQGNLYDVCNRPNDDTMRVLGVRQFKLGASYASATGPATSGSYYDNSPMTKIITFNWGKHTRKQLKFDTDVNGDLPINDNVYMVCQVVHASNQYNPADYPAFCTFVSEMFYEDA